MVGALLWQPGLFFYPFQTRRRLKTRENAALRWTRFLGFSTKKKPFTTYIQKILGTRSMALSAVQMSLFIGLKRMNGLTPVPFHDRQVGVVGVSGDIKATVL
ncbi:MAG: hypothetical protein ABJH45_19120 [Paracoccaceae bacterium]